jgi:hypothetical protein
MRLTICPRAVYRAGAGNADQIYAARTAPTKLRNRRRRRRLLTIRITQPPVANLRVLVSE